VDRRLLRRLHPVVALAACEAAARRHPRLTARLGASAHSSPIRHPSDAERRFDVAYRRFLTSRRSIDPLCMASGSFVRTGTRRGKVVPGPQNPHLVADVRDPLWTRTSLLLGGRLGGPGAVLFCRSGHPAHPRPKFCWTEPGNRFATAPYTPRRRWFLVRRRWSS